MDRILFGGTKPRHPASLAQLAERTITLGGVSKNYRMIGGASVGQWGWQK